MRAATIAHLYHVGEKVTFNPGAGFNVKASEAYTVRAQLPPVGGDVFQYRVKSDSEPYERVVSEAQIAPLSPTIRSGADAISWTPQLT